MYTSSQLLPMQNVLVFHYKFYCTCCVIVSYIILYVFRYKQQSVICISNPNCKLKKKLKKICSNQINTYSIIFKAKRIQYNEVR